MLNEGILASIWVTMGTMRQQWRSGCKPFHSWKQPGDFRTAWGQEMYDPKMFGGIKQCRRCGAIRSA